MNIYAYQIFFTMATSTSIEYTGGVFELPLNALVLLPFILFRNIQRGIERGISVNTIAR